MNAPVLGVNVGTHDAAAVAGGRVLAAGEEERFTRAKHTKAFPERAIRYCLAQAGIDARDVGTVALFVDPRRHLLLPLANLYHGFPASLGSLASDIGKYRQRTAAPHSCLRPVPPGLPRRARGAVCDRLTWSFIRYIWGYRKTMRPWVRQLLAEHGGNVRLVALTSRRQADRFVAQLEAESATGT